MLGLAPPSQVSSYVPGMPSGSTAVGPSSAYPMTAYAGGTVAMKSVGQMLDEQKRASEQAQNAPLITGLSAHVRKHWQINRQAKQNTVEQRMFQSLRARRGEYDPDTLARIKEQTGSEIYMMITSVKCRAAASWLRDILLGTRDDKPWTLDPSPLPDMPPAVQQTIEQIVQAQVQQLLQAGGAPPTPELVDLTKRIMHDKIISEAQDAARESASNMELKMEDQLDEGGWFQAMDQFIDDITTFPAAILKGPVIRNKPHMEWQGDQLIVEDKLVLEWERVDPFNVYPSPLSSGPDDGNFLERHRLTRQDLNDLIGVEGYDDGAIRSVIEQYGRGGLREWLAMDTTKAEAEGKSTTQVLQNSDELIDALQFWGSASGQMLLDWGVDKDKVDDATKEYQCEVWLIGQWVIKATLNPDPLRRRPYYKAAYEEIPGSFWGNSVADLVRDCQTMCNAAARAMANNMAVASGPMVWINVERMPTGEDITELHPWKIFQGTSDPMGGTANPIVFFQPQSFVGELQQVFQQYSLLADEYSGVPRYMTGTEGTPGAGRTASGLSMMITNAGKAIKQVIGNIDVGILKPLIERLYYYNMRYADDPALKGDVNIVARGANSLVVKDAAAQRRNEFLQMVLQSPVVQQVVPPEGLAALLREGAKMLDMDTDLIVPSDAQIRAKNLIAQAQALQQQQQQAAAQAALQQQPQQNIQFHRGPDGSVQGASVMQGPNGGPTPLGTPGNMPPQPGPGQNLMDGAPVTNAFPNRPQ